MTPRLIEIANAAGLPPQNAVSVRRMPPETIDAILTGLLEGRDAASIAAGLHEHKVPDGYRIRGVLIEDVRTMAVWLRQARQRLRWQDADLDRQVARHDQLLTLLEPGDRHA